MNDKLWKKTMAILRELNIDVLTEMGCYRRFNEVMIDIEKVYNNGTERNKELIRQLFL